jgi:hypothetical protein
MSRPVDVLRLSLGVAALGAPGVVLPAAANTPWTRGFTRILGARYVAQSAFGLAERRPWVPAADAAVDGVHALTMLGLAAVSPRHRRVALSSAAAALAFAYLDLQESES